MGCGSNSKSSVDESPNNSSAEQASSPRSELAKEMPFPLDKTFASGQSSVVEDPQPLRRASDWIPPDQRGPLDVDSSPAAGSALPAGAQLRSDLNAVELGKFLSQADEELRSLINGRSGITDPNAVESETKRVVELKRTAAERLANATDATEPLRVQGRRGYLQAMSHLASMGDLQAAEKLQLFAEQYQDDSHNDLRTDSRLVLIGLAIESLRHGKKGAAAKVLDLTGDLADNGQKGDVATLMVMGQAKDTLLQYEHIDEAQQVRRLILDQFAGADDPEVARMASMIAASGFAEMNKDLQKLDDLRTAIVTPDSGGPVVTKQEWGDAVQTVLNQSVDLLTIQFLAGMSLEAEAIGRDDIADTTYELLKRDVADRTDAVGREARTAVQAKWNREKIIGEVFDPELPGVDGRSLSMADFRGKVVLMPFWSGAFPDSLSVLPELLAIENQNPGKVAVVGMNLDLAGTDVASFMDRSSLDFPSFRSESDPSAEITNPVAYQFGAVSLVFVAVIDPSGKVVSVEFSGQDLSKKVSTLIR